MVPHCAAPCMSGGMIMNERGKPFTARSAIVNSVSTRWPVIASMPWPSAMNTSS